MITKILYTLFTKGFTAIVNFLILIISSRFLGADVRGEISLLVLNIAIVQIINEVYTGYSLVHFIPKYDLRKVYAVGVLWTIVINTIINACFCYFTTTYTHHWHLFFISLIVILHTFNMVILLGKGKIALYNILSFFQPFTLLVAVILLIKNYNIKTLDCYIIALYISFAIPIILSSYVVLKSLLQPEKDLLKDYDLISILKNGFYNQLSNLSHTFSNRFNYYFLKGQSLALVGIYSTASPLIESVWIVASSISPILLSNIANAGDTRFNKQITFTLSKISFLMSCILVVLVLILPQEFFTDILGKKFEDTKQIMLWLSPGILAISFSTIISHYFSGLGMQKYIAIANTSGLIVTVCLSPLLIHKYHILGAAITANCSYITIMLILSFVFFRKNGFSLKSIFDLEKDKVTLEEAIKR